MENQFKIINDENKEGREGSFLKLHKIGIKLENNYFLYPEEAIEFVWGRKAKIFKLKKDENLLKIESTALKHFDEENIDDFLCYCYDDTQKIYENMSVLNAFLFFRRRGIFLKR